MKNFNRFLSFLMTIIMLVSLVGCAGNNGGNTDNTPPDANENLTEDTENTQPLVIPEKVNYLDSGKSFDFFSYRSVSNGTYKLYDRPYDVGESYITKEYIKQYFESGLKFLCPQAMAPANSEARPFVGSDLEKVMNICHELGYDKSVVLTDNQIYTPYYRAIANCSTETDWSKITCIGNAEWQWKSEEELDAFMEQQLKNYCYHPAFQGVFMPDEPKAQYMKVIGETYKSLRRVQKKLGIEEMFININLFPYYTNLCKSAYPSVEADFSLSEVQRQHEGYRRYIKSYFEETGADYVQADVYPMNEKFIYRLYVLNLQIMAEVAKEYDAKIIIVTQSHYNVGQRPTSYESLKYMNNLTFGFGGSNIGYYSYFTLDDSGNYNHFDNGSMVSRFGDKTPVYDMVKDLNVEAQKLAPTILNFKYKTSATYLKNDATTFLDHMSYANKYIGKNDLEPFTKLKQFDFDKEMAIVTELYDAEKDNYMYMAFNSIDPLNKGTTVYQTSKLTFSEEYNKALVFYNGEYSIIDLEQDHSLTVKTHPGEAQFIIPFAG